ncbi:MAG: glycosyltransferase, partial [Planctomycetota bacterium]
MQRTPDGPALSLLVPTYGRPDKAHALLERLARQTAPPGTFEVVLVDDGSDPPLEAPARELPFALTLLRQENAGPAAARNRGLEAVRADLVLILNDDCVPSDDLVEKHLAAHAELTGDVAVLGTFGFTERSKESAFTRLLEDSTLLFAYPALEHGGRYGWDVFWTCNISLSAQAIRDVGGFDAARFDRAICEDVELGARLASRGLSVVYREDCIAHHEHRMDPVEYMDRAFTLGIYQCRLASKFGHPELFFPNGAVGADGAPADWLRSAIQDCESSALEALDALVEVEEVFEARPMPEDTVRDAREVVLRHSQFFRLAGLHLELTGEDLRPNALLDAARARRDARHAARSIRSAGAPSVRAPGSAMVPSAAAPSEAGPSEVDPAGASASTPASASPVRSAVRLSERGPDAPELSIVVVSCDALDNTRRCVESLRAAADPRFPQEILAVDNGSTDGSAEWLAEQADVTLVRNAANHGAPRARNQGIARARGAWIAFFDNDVVVPRAWIPRALEHARNADDVGAIPLCANRASKHQVVAYDGTDDIASIERFANTHYGQHAGEGVDATLFTSLAVVVRREVVERIGGFDETFSPWGFEDDDYALRVRLAGWRNRVARDSFVYHAHYQTQEKHERHAGWLQANWDAFLAKWCPGRAGARLFDYEGVTVPSVETVTDAQLVFALPADGAEPPHWDGAEHGAARTVEAENEPGESTSHGATDAFRAITEEIRSVADANATLRPVPKPGGAARRPAQPRAAETQSGATF